MKAPKPGKKATLDPRLAALIENVKAKRPRTVIEHIKKHGQVTTDELKSIHGYDHPPRAARDVRELGIPLKTVRVPGPNGRKIAAYTFGDADSIESHKTGGRKGIPKALKDALRRLGEECAICGAKFAGHGLQIDHRIPYEVGGDSDFSAPAEFMLLCGPCNRQKGRACELCTNWSDAKDVDICRTCYWANPDTYDHVAGLMRRSCHIHWDGEDCARFERLVDMARTAGLNVQTFVKQLLDQESNPRDGVDRES
jgi:hypothetical protein